VLIALEGLLAYLFVRAVQDQPDVPLIVGSAVGWVVVGVLFIGFFIVNPNEGRVLQWDI
jgi:hypothetical protein